MRVKLPSGHLRAGLSHIASRTMHRGSLLGRGGCDGLGASPRMATARISLLVVLAGLACSSSQVVRDRGPAQPTARYVLPPPKEVREGTGAFVLSKRTPIRGEPSAVALLREE